MTTTTFNPIEFVNTVKNVYKTTRNIVRESNIKNLIRTSTRLLGYDDNDVYLFLLTMVEDIDPDWMEILDDINYNSVVKSLMGYKDLEISSRLNSRLEGINLNKKKNSKILKDILFKVLDEKGINLETYVITLVIDTEISWDLILENIIKMGRYVLPIPTIDEVMSMKGTIDSEYLTYTSYTDEELDSFRDVPKGLTTTSSVKKGGKKKVSSKKKSSHKKTVKVGTVTITGTKRNSHLMKQIDRFNLDGELIDTYESISQAARETKSNRSHINTHLTNPDEKKSIRSKVDGKNYIYKYHSVAA